MSPVNCSFISSRNGVLSEMHQAPKTAKRRARVTVQSVRWKTAGSFRQAAPCRPHTNPRRSQPLGLCARKLDAFDGLPGNLSCGFLGWGQALGFPLWLWLSREIAAQIQIRQYSVTNQHLVELPIQRPQPPHHLTLKQSKAGVFHPGSQTKQMQRS